MTEAQVDSLVKQFQSILTERGKTKSAIFDLIIGNQKLQDRVKKLQVESDKQAKKFDYLSETNTKLAQELDAFKTSYSRLYAAFETSREGEKRLRTNISMIREVLVPRLYATFRASRESAKRSRATILRLEGIISRIREVVVPDYLASAVEPPPLESDQTRPPARGHGEPPPPPEDEAK